eukprot:192674-Rhodomonas_salina.2
MPELELFVCGQWRFVGVVTAEVTRQPRWTPHVVSLSYGARQTCRNRLQHGQTRGERTRRTLTRRVGVERGSGVAASVGSEGGARALEQR